MGTSMQLPVLQAIVLADHIYIDLESKKKIIAGTFDALHSESFPATLGRVTRAFISLTELLGEVSVSLKYVDLDSNEVLMSIDNLQVRSDDPLTTLSFVVDIPPFPMPHAGVYAFELHCQGQMLGALRLSVTGNEAETEAE